MAEEKRLTLKFAYMKGNLSPSVISFLVRDSTPFAKVFKAWREKEGVSENSFRFLFEGTTIDKDDTCVARPPAFAASSARLIVNLFLIPARRPKMLGMEDGVQVDVMLEQLGGGR